ncbi:MULTISPECIES: phosphotransferase family protein [unclassified Gemella]|uniref:phosphotransferase family protein n=1 Tax=unclassified Gemella TaxID=2624949 RepID=UPI001C05C0A2|nr:MULTISPECIES: phosphotransferase family protein [unclassified Gemella]MBU0278800.1 phosphotransferase family protein [Gemella sp. zg-1178]QWQ39350.1 phosphotransferase family protein [Gemella sp. zg-570]
MAREYYQMGWTLGEQYEEDYYFSREDNKYFIKKNTTPLIATLSAEKIVPKLKWTRRLSNGDVIIAQDFENGRTLLADEMTDPRIPKILSRVHNSVKIKKLMQTQGFKETTALSSLRNLEKILSEELLRNSDIAMVFNYLKNNVPITETFSPCHADLHKDNWLLSDSGKLFLVDWEQSILGDAAIDISFILYRYIPQKDWDLWLESYGIKSSLAYRLKLKWYMSFQSLVMVVWYHEKQQFAEMNEWLLFINKIFLEYV